MRVCKKAVTNTLKLDVVEPDYMQESDPDGPAMILLIWANNNLDGRKKT